MSTEPKLWTLATLRSARADAAGVVDVDPNNPVAFSIPQFQRSLVWPEPKQRDLIASILKGFPMGALLLVEHAAKRQVTLPNGGTVDATVYGIIDGLQRTNAIASHLQKSLAFATEEAVEGIEFQAFHTAIENECGATDVEALMAEIIGWMSDTKEPLPTKGFDFDTLLDAVGDGLALGLSPAQKQSLKPSANALIQFIGKRVDIGNYQIPVLVYKGSKANLPDIFEKINTAGTILSKYEVFAASWVSTEVVVTDTAIQKAIQRRYKVLQDRGFEVESGSAPTVFSLFDYLHGLSQVMGERYPLLFSAKDAKANNLSGAFPLATLMLGQTLDKMDELDKHFPTNSSGQLKVDKFQAALFESAKFVNAALAPHLAFKFVSDKEAPGHGELQIVSMIAAVAANLFDHTTEFSDRGSLQARKATKKKFELALPQHYIYDIIRQYWRGSLYTYAFERVWDAGTPSKTYLTAVDSKSFDSALKTLMTEQAAKVSHRRSNITAFDRIFLKFVYSKKVSVADQAAHKFDVEHWLPIKRLQDLTQNTEPWPMGMMGNLGVLPRGSNRRKKDETVSEYVNRTTRKPTPAEVTVIKKLLFVPLNSIGIQKNASGADKMTRTQYDALVRKNWNAMCKDLKNNIGL